VATGATTTTLTPGNTTDTPSSSSQAVQNGAHNANQSQVDRIVVCYKCEKEGNNSKECSLKVVCLVCEKDTHITRRCVWPNQTKPVMPAINLADPNLGFFVAQQM
jgi:hypothetical protein